jgi:hypothetical protein
VHSHEELVPVLPIHEVLQAVFQAGESNTSLLGGLGPDSVARFWSNAEGQDWFACHPGVQRLRRENMLGKTLPLHFHQDGVEVYRDVESNIWSWGSAMTSQNSVETKFLLGHVWEFSMPNKDVRKRVNQEFCKYIDWCLRVCESGMGPTHGFYGEILESKLAGKELFGGWRAVFAGWKGDGKARKVENDFKRAWDSTYICMNCAACQPYSQSAKPLWYTHVGDGDQNLCTLPALGPHWAGSLGLAKSTAYALVLVMLISTYGRSNVHGTANAYSISCKD